jgi:hypothetical protein
MWITIVTSFENHDDVIAGHPDCTGETGLPGTTLLTVRHLNHISTPINGNGSEWKELIAKAEAETAL